MQSSFMSECYAQSAGELRGERVGVPVVVGSPVLLAVVVSAVDGLGVKHFRELCSCEYVFCGEICPQPLYFQRFRPFFGQGVANLEVLQADVGCILEVACLHLMVSSAASVALPAAVKRRAWVICVPVHAHDSLLHEQRVLVTVEVEVLDKRSRPFGLGVGSPEIGTALPVVAFHNALEKEPQIDSLSREVEVNSEMEARRAVAYDLEVPVVVYGAVSGGYASVAVEVGVHYVTCAPSASEGGLSLTEL